MNNLKAAQLFAGVVLIFMFVVSCGGSAVTSSAPTPRSTTEMPTQRPQPSYTPRPTDIPPVTATSYPQPDLSGRPLIFFGPMPKPDGSLDYMDLFTEDAPWTQAAEHIQVFNLFGGWVAHFPWEPPDATEDELRQIVNDLNRRGMAIGFEASPLVATDKCGRGIEGFFGPEEGLRIVNTLKRLGANVSYVSLDEPFAFGHIYSGSNACQWPAEKIAQQVQAYIAAIHTVYPDAIIGDNEPLWQGVDVKELIDWLDAYKTVTSSNLPFIHLDLDFSRVDWPVAAKQLEDAARSRGIEFGIFYLGDAGDATDAVWLNKAFERARIYELVTGGKPDHVKFESWVDRPDFLLPETKPDTFTALINRYFRPRPALSLSLKPAGGTQNITGSLSDETGAPLVDSAIELTMKALDGPGLVAEYTITNIVPKGAVSAGVGFRVNTECGCQGASEFNLYQVRYTEEDETTSRVPNYKFSRGLENWGAWGSSSVKFVGSDQGSGGMLHIVATSGQDAAINSVMFPVTPGAAYTLTFTARISPQSAGSGYLAIFFSDNQQEFKRETIPLAPGIIQLGAATTDAQGAFVIPLKPLPKGKLLLEASYAGSDLFWPAYASLLLPLP